MKIKINQHQSFYSLEKSACIVDFIKNEMVLFSNSNIVVEREYDQYYDNLDKVLTDRVSRCGKKQASVTLVLGFKCNLRCVYCYEFKCQAESFDSSVITSRIAPELIAEYILDILIKSDVGRIRICFTGGEPFLSDNIYYLRDLVSKINNYCQGFDIEYSAVTNGVNVWDFIDDIESLRINELQFTIDGLEKVHNNRRISLDSTVNSFKSPIRGIELALEKGFRVMLRVNVDQNNLCEITKLNDLIISRGWNENPNFYPYLYPVTISGSTSYRVEDDELTLFKKLLNEIESVDPFIFRLDFHGVDYIDSLVHRTNPCIRNRYCGLSNGQQVVIDDGRVYSCWWGIGNDAFLIDDLRCKEDFIKARERQFSFRDSLIITKCKSCKFKYICGAGCAYKAWHKYGDSMRPNCANFDELIWHYLNYLDKKGELNSETT